MFLKKENWLVSLIIFIFSQGIFSLILAYFLGIYDKKAWYCKWQYWVISLLFLFFPIFIVFAVFNIQISCEVANKLNVPGHKIYTCPYVWILCLIVPVVGWVLLLIMLMYIEIWPIVMLHRGEGEKYIK